MATKAISICGETGLGSSNPYAGPDSPSDQWLEGWVKRVKKLNQEQEADNMARKKKRGKKKREMKERE